jgi:hypothetical protein
MSILDLIAQEKEREAFYKAKALETTPREYSHYITMIENGVKLTGANWTLNKDETDAGAYATKNGIYIKSSRPYMSVDGKMKWFTDIHKEANAKYKITSNMELLIKLMAAGKFSEKMPVVIDIDSEVYGLLTGISTVHWGGSGADSTNALENAATSALGRALSKAGLGLYGVGIASSEEMNSALKEKERTTTTPSPTTVTKTTDKTTPSAGEEFVFNFGKYDGKKITDVPEDYLNWLVDHADKDWLRKKAQEEIARRNSEPKNKQADIKELRDKKIAELIHGDASLRQQVISYLKYLSEEKKSKVEIVDLNEKEFQSLVKLLNDMQPDDTQNAEGPPDDLGEFGDIYDDIEAPF